MKEINIKLPLYKQAYVLAENFKEIGIKCVYNHANKKVYLSLLNAPTFVVGEPMQMTLRRCFNSLKDVRDNFQEYANGYKKMYKIVYSNNIEMLEFLNKQK
mgnify:FL=1